MHHLGTPQRIEVKGKIYTLGRLTRGDMMQFIQWVNSKTPHPLEELTMARLSKLSPFLQEILVKHAMDKSEMRNSYNSPHIQAALNSPEGIVKLFELVLVKQHADIKSEEAARIYDDCLEEHGDGYLREKLARTQGIYEDGDEEEDDGQKKILSLTTGSE